MRGRQKRLRAIKEILRNRMVRSQLELRDTLAEHGFNVTQATLSRDLRVLGAVKTRGGYRLPEQVGESVAAREEIARFIISVDVVKFIVIVKTEVGHAQPVGVLLDTMGDPDVAGCVAGDNTIFVVCKEADAARRFAKKLSSICSF